MGGQAFTAPAPGLLEANLPKCGGSLTLGTSSLTQALTQCRAQKVFSSGHQQYSMLPAMLASIPTHPSSTCLGP
jgi:hypothetical protein